MPRPSNTQERRAQIAAALVGVMAHRGYEGASVADIARAAGLTAGLVHYHFASKQEILLEALALLAARHGADLEARLEPLAGDPAAQLAALVDFHVGLGADADAEALACWVLLAGEALRQPEVQRAYERVMSGIVARVAALVGEGVAARVFRCPAAGVDAAAAALVAAIQGYFVLATAARAAVPRGSAAACVLQMADGLLRPERPLAPPAKRKRRARA